MVNSTLKTIAIAALAMFVLVQSGSANENLYDQALQSTVWIVGSTGSGTGVLVDESERLVLTNYHVTKGQKNIAVVFPIMRAGRAVSERDFYLANPEERSVKGTIVACDQLRDIAIVKVDSIPDGVVPIQFGKPSRPGQTVHSIGNPAARDALWIYTCGKVRQNYYRKSQIKDYGTIQMQMLETDSPINPGDSGGPIVNDNGELVGISQSISLDSRLYSYGVDISEITWYLNKYRKSETSVAQADQEPDNPSVSGARTAGSFKDISMFNPTIAEEK